MSLFGQPAASSSASAPSLFGGSAAQSQSLFGSTAGQSYFGAPQPTQQSLFASPQQTQPSLFGAPAHGQQPQQQGSSLFGTSGVAQPQTSLFGSQSQGGAPGAAQSQPSLFGAPSSQSSLFGPASSQPSLFGGASSQSSLFGGASSQPSLFGGASSQPSLFGGGSSQPSLFGVAASQSSLFGAQSQPSQFSSQSQSSFFGGGSGSFLAQSQSNLGFGSGFGLGQQQSSQFQQAGSLFPYQSQHYAQFQAQNPVPPSARVDQLPSKAIELLESVQKRLSDQRAKASHLTALQISHEESMRLLRDECASSRRRLVRADTGVEDLTTNANALRQAVRDDRRAADNVAHSLAQLCRSLDPLGSSHAWYNAYSYGVVNDIGPVPPYIMHINPGFFAAVVAELEERAKSYKREIDQIAEFLRMEGAGHSAASHGFDALEARMHNSRNGSGISAGNAAYTDLTVIGSSGTSRRRAEAKGRAIEDVIRRQFEYFMSVANKTAAVYDALARLKEAYLADARCQDPDAVDPFAQADSRERAEDEKRRRIAAAIQPSGLLTAQRSSPSGPSTSHQNGQLQTQSAAASGFNANTNNPADPGQAPAAVGGAPVFASFGTPSLSTSLTGFDALHGGSPSGGSLGSSSARRPVSSGSGTRRHRAR